MQRYANRFRPTVVLLLTAVGVVVGSLSCLSDRPTIAEDADPTATSASRLTFETRQPLIAGGKILPDDPLVVVFTPGSRLETGSLVSLAFPTAVQEEAGDLWSIPVDEAGTPGACLVAESSMSKIKIETAGRIKGGAGRIVFRATRRLEAGESVRLHMSGQVPKIVPHRPFRVIELDAATGELARLPDSQIEVTPIVAENATRMLATLPSDAGTGERVRLRLAAIDRFGNVDTAFRGPVAISGSLDRFPDSVSFGVDDHGLKTVEGDVGSRVGVARIAVAATFSYGASAVESNPMMVWAGTPQMRRFAGDAHFHSGSNVVSVTTDGGDHRGQFVSSTDAFTYLRDVAGADWGISAEHDTGLSSATWLANQQHVASIETEGRFVTLLGYEWTPPRRLGHHVVVFEGPPGTENPLVGASSGRRGGEGASRIAELAAALRLAVTPGHRALLIPHVMQPFPNGDTDREEHNLPHEIWDGPPGSPSGSNVFNDLRRVGEFYSHHNDDFSIDGFRQTREGRGDAVNQPQLFEVGVANSWTYQHAWATGHRIGVIGGSDNHFGTPGLNDFVPTIPHHAGLSIVFAPELSHGGIFAGLYDRRCYATSGARILVDVTVDGLLMGAEASRPSRSRVPIQVRVAGTARLESVEVLKYSAGDFVVVPGQISRSSEKDLTMTLVDVLDASTLYYVRVRQSDGEWAWTSPVWIDVPADSM